MKKMKTDRRVRRTQNALKTNLLLLMKEQPIQKISVSRLCEKSDINRSTFYTYYSSPMDLLHSIEDEILQKLEESIFQYQQENSLPLFQFLHSIVHYISSHQNLIRLIFSDNGDPGFLNQLTLTLQEKTIKNWKTRFPSCSEESLITLHTFISRGCIGVIESWIRNGFQTSEEEISHILELLSRSAASAVLKNRL